ncbi:MAG: hypothetical protein NVSMB48_09380 [Marmoricola sp.]
MAEPVGEVNADRAGDEDASSGRRLVNAVMALAAVAGLVGVGLMLRVTLADRRDDEATRDAVTAAERLVEAVTSVDADNLSADIDAVLDLATGDFKDQFASQRASYLDAVTKAKVSSVGRVVESGVVSSSAKEVVVLVAASSTISNPKATDGDKRAYRMKVTVVHRSDKWLVSELELVA